MPANTKAETARQNGAKSKGPATEAGKDRCRHAAAEAAARRAAGAKLDCTLLPTESRETLDACTAEEFDAWQPKTPTQRQLVHELTDINWRITRLRFAQTQALAADMESQRCSAAKAEIAGSTLGATQQAVDRRIAVLAVVRSRILRDLERLAKRFEKTAEKQTGSQPELKRQDLPENLAWRVPADTQPEKEPEPEPVIPDPPPGILGWARTNFDFIPDPHQAELMTTEAKEVLMLGGRQTGKSTAAALRVVYEALYFAQATILLAGPTGRQSGQIMLKARNIAKSIGLTLGAPPLNCDGFTLANGSQVVSLPGNPAKIRAFSAPRLIVVDEAAFASDELIGALTPMLAVSGGRMFFLTTPNGQSGYFYDKWEEKNGSFHKIFCKSSDCRRIKTETLDSFRRRMTEEQYSQEFDCVFTAPPEQFISRELFRRAIRDDIKPLFEEDDDD